MADNQCNKIPDGLGILFPKNPTNYTLDEHVNQTESSNSTSSDNSCDRESLLSDCESNVSGPSCDSSPPLANGLIQLLEGDQAHDLIKERFLSGLGSLGSRTEVLAVGKNGFSSVMWQARLQSFHIFAKAIAKKCGGDPNIRFAWCSASRDAVRTIMEHGFTHCGLPVNNGLYGCGFYLAPDNCPIECLRNAIADESGLRYLLLCRVLLGKAEVVSPGSQQCHPSSSEFDLGLDNLSSPTKYIVWSNQMNTHVVPEFVLTFRAPTCLKEFLGTQERLRRPTSPWMSFPSLISSLSKFLSPPSISLISKHHKDYRERKISRQELIREVRKIAGDRLLIAVIKSSGSKRSA